MSIGLVLTLYYILIYVAFYSRNNKCPFQVSGVVLWIMYMCISCRVLYLVCHVNTGLRDGETKSFVVHSVAQLVEGPPLGRKFMAGPYH